MSCNKPMRDNLIEELAGIEANAIIDWSHSDVRGMLINGVVGYKDMSDEELITYTKEFHDNDCHPDLFFFMDELEASLVIEEVLLENKDGW